MLWRNLAVAIDDGINDIGSEFHKAEEAWRQFLFDEQPLTSYNRVHVFVAGIPSSGPAGHSVYRSRDADFIVVTRGSLPIAVYAKFSSEALAMGIAGSCSPGIHATPSHRRSSSRAR